MYMCIAFRNLTHAVCACVCVARVIIVSAFLLLFQSSEEELPVCEKWAVCSKVDMYQWPWVERQCRCPSGVPPCSQMLSPADGHTITDKTRQFKVKHNITVRCGFYQSVRRVRKMLQMPMARSLALATDRLLRETRDIIIIREKLRRHRCTRSIPYIVQNTTRSSSGFRSRFES